jgi:multidrug efflux system membrane fusion protein
LRTSVEKSLWISIKLSLNYKKSTAIHSDISKDYVMKGTIKKIISIKSSYVVGTLLALGTVLWIGSGFVSREQSVNLSDQPKIKTKQLLPFVRVIESVAQTQNQNIVLFGYTKAIKQADIAAEISGRITNIMVDKGDVVIKGQALYRLSMENRLSQLSEANANHEHQKISYNAAKRLSKKQFQSKVTLAKVKAELASAKAALSAIELGISKTTIRAPINGYVNKLPLSVGDYVRSGEIVSVVVDLDPIKIVGEVSERDISRIQIGQKVVAQLTGDQKVNGFIKYISRVGSSATRTFTVDVWINNPLGTIHEGLTAKLHLPVESGLAHFVSPAVLSLDSEGAIGVKAVNEESIVTFHRVKIIADTTGGVWLDGLPERLTLITVGQEFVVTGKKVRTTIDVKTNTGTGAINVEKHLQGNPS